VPLGRNSGTARAAHGHAGASHLASASAARGGGAARRPNGGTPPAHGRRPRKRAAHRREDDGAARRRWASGEAARRRTSVDGFGPWRSGRQLGRDGERCRGGGARGEACGGGRDTVGTTFKPPCTRPDSAAHDSQSRLGAARHCH
jgi:hypothetical protein